MMNHDLDIYSSRNGFRILWSG